MVVLDTDVIVHFLRRDKEVTALVSRLNQSREKITTTVINEFELWKGIHRTKINKEEKELNQFISQLSVYFFERESSKKSAEIYEFLRKKGQTIDFLDVMIASIAIVNNEKLYTLNKKHFENIPELSLL